MKDKNSSKNFEWDQLGVATPPVAFLEPYMSETNGMLNIQNSKTVLVLSG